MDVFMRPAAPRTPPPASPAREITPKTAEAAAGDAMDVEELPAGLEVPSFLPALLIEALGYPAGLGARSACASWRDEAERVFRRELAELRCASRCQAEYLELPPTTKSTISVAFSPDEKRFASTHGARPHNFTGDHTVKVVDFDSGEVVATLAGHPRTPWTVKFHPFLPDVVASGCLGFEARVWDCATGRCVRRAEFDRAIISLSFHPAGDILAVAAGTSIFLWDYHAGAPPRKEFTHAHPIRCLRFLPSRDALVVGAANSTMDDTVGEARITFQLMLCAFDVGAAREDAARGLRTGAASPTSVRATTNNSYEDPPLLAPVPGAGRAIGRDPRTVLKRALFYNDGGFDVSPCGRFLCSCAELWLPYADAPKAALERYAEGERAEPRVLAKSRPEDREAWPLPSFAASRRLARPPARPLGAPRDPPRRDAPLVDWWRARPLDRARAPEPLKARSAGRSAFPNPFRSAPRTPEPQRGPVAVPPPPPGRGLDAGAPEGRFKPHLVVISLEDAHPSGEGALLQATPLDDKSFSGTDAGTAGSDIVTSVKLSPTASLVLLGHSRGGDGASGDGVPRVVSVTYRVGDMARVNVRKEVGDDVNIARFHPVPGAGIVYGTKQGKICKMTPLA